MSATTSKTVSFQEQLKLELELFLKAEKSKFPEKETLKVDLHCHDHNSNVPDELIGRILRVPETWLPTKQLLKTLKKNKTDVVTITNHNNSQSCFDLIDKGHDILVGSEFSCFVPDFEIGIHVLTYGFSKKQEKILNKLRKNVYQFLKYTCANDIPTIWAHPLYHYASKDVPTFDFFSKMALVFERFEVLNGQRDTWQNMLVKNWLEQLTKEQIDADAEKFDIDISLYCKNPYKKSFSGGSDDHVGIFAGQTGTNLYVPNLEERIKTESVSELALEAIRRGDMAPYGTHQNSGKLTVALLDYVCQIAMYRKDPGLFRMILHKGTYKDKILAFLVTNAFAELKRHKVTMRFVEMFHNCFIGIEPPKIKRLLITKDYKPVFDEAKKISKAHEHSNEAMVEVFNESLNSITEQLNQILFRRLKKKIDSAEVNKAIKNIDFESFIENLEIPSEIRSLFDEDANKSNGRMSNLNISDFFDDISFPALASAIFLGANFTSSKVLYNTRPLLNSFSNKIGKLNHPQRMLWLTDTYNDKNGVSIVLQEIHKEIKANNLPIDILVCSNDIKPDKNLIVVEPMLEFTLPFYTQQHIRIPDFNKIHNLFHTNEYDRIICSTEGVMGIAAIYLKNAYKVPTHFYIHTDWIMFGRKVIGLDIPNLDRLRRMLRTYYGAFDKIFVLNSDQQKWLTGFEMGFKSNKVLQTAHWVNEKFTKKETNKKKAFGLKESDKVVLFAGRLSKEKGVFDIVEISKKVNKELENIKFVFAGTGQAEKDLKKQMPDAIFTGWVDNNKLPELYSAADLLILPSKFDTFSCVVLEALSCSLPVVAYESKGPKDIIEHNESGFLASGKKEMAKYIVKYFVDNKLQEKLKKNSVKRSKIYNKKAIMQQLLEDVGLASNY